MSVIPIAPSPGRASNSRMKKLALAIGVPVVAVVAATGIVAARFEPTILPKTYVGMVDVGGLSKDEAARKVRIWWDATRQNKLTLENKLFLHKLPAMTPTMLGVAVDDQASVADLPMSDVIQAVSAKVTGGPQEPQKFPVEFKAIAVSLANLKKRIVAAVGDKRPARVTYRKGVVVRSPELSGFELDEKSLFEAVVAGIGKGIVEAPLQEGPKQIPDAELDKIKDVVSQYSTTFPSYQTSRNTNIRLATQKLDGVVLMPGQKISFNQTVGQRTVEGGYKEAPVLVYGRHDTGIGGGICQVSTTLYNAALLADMKVVRRNNHSIPSVYVPVGRDATVDWGTLDLILENSSDLPIAIASTYENGRITFRILGQKDPSLKVKIVTENHRVWSRDPNLVVDAKLAPGARKVVDRGSRAHSIDTYRIVYRNGVEIRRDHLSKSNYVGCPATIAYNPAKPKPAAPPPLVTTPPPPGP